MAPRERIYLDNAATGWPKADGVLAAVAEYLRDSGAPAGRSTYQEASDVERRLQRLRRDLAERIGADDARRIVFTFNGTDSLNLALQGILRPGDHVVTTEAEHNSVLRPLAWLAEHRGVRVERARCDGAGRVDADDLRRRLRPGETRLVALVHASNVTGVVQPVAEVAEATRAAGARLLVDAAQSLGQWPVSVRDLPLALLAAPGHKSLGGPLGTGFLYVAPGVETELEPTRQGGTGTRSEDERQPDSLPDRYEAGNHNVPGLIGLGASVAELTTAKIVETQLRFRELTRRMRDGLGDVRGVKLFVPERVEDQLGVVSLTIAGFEPQEAAATLDAAFGIQVRAGLHCAPGVHRALGTFASGGTLRLSWGRATTSESIDAAIAAIAELAASV